jgi:sporulation integral membrane protein YlbJ
VLFATCLLIGGGYLSSAKRGLYLFATSVLPCLFPYAFISASLSMLGVTSKISTKATPFTKKVFNVGGVSAYALFISLIAGYPIGAKTVADLKERGLLSQTESIRASAFCSTSSPAFLLSTVGAVCFNSPLFGVLLFLSHLLSCFLVGIIFSFYKRKDTPSDTFPPPVKVDNVFYESVFSAINSALFVGGVITLFSVIIDLLFATNLLFIPTKVFSFILGDGYTAKSLCAGIVECTVGISMLCKRGITPLALPICGLTCGFGGICIIAQSITFLKKAKIKTAPFLIAKLLHGGFSFIFCLIFNLFIL